MNRTLSLLCATLLAPTFAQAALPTTTNLTVDSRWLLEASPGTFYSTGLGSPTITFHEATDQWMMFFETRVAASPGASGHCPAGNWSIGRATSPDGINWTVDSAPILGATPGTFYSCYATQPSVVNDHGTLHLFFKPGQENNVSCTTNTPAWGCDQIPGIGHATSTDGISWTVDSTVAVPVHNFGFPKATKLNDTWHLLFTWADGSIPDYDVYHSTSIDDGATWTTPTSASQPGFATWAHDELFNPAVTCREDATSPLVGWFGGRETTADFSSILTASVGKSYSSDGATWSYDNQSPYISMDLTTDPGTDWRHWDAIRMSLDNGDEHFLIVFAQKDTNNHNRIGFATTIPAGITTDYIPRRWVHHKVCIDGEDNRLLPQDTGAPDTGLDDTGSTDTGTTDTGTTDTGTTDTGSTDTGSTDTGTTDTQDTSDTSDDGSEGGCNCDATGTPSMLGFLLIPAVALIRRQRR